MAEWSQYGSHPNEEYLQAFAKSPPPLTGDWAKNLEEGLKVMVTQQSLVAAALRKKVEDADPPKGITIEEKHVPVSSPLGEILIRIYTPETGNPLETFPGYVHIHGGAFFLGSIDAEEFLCREISSKHCLIVINVEYRLAPQFPFPTGLEDSYAAVKWVASNAAGIRINLKKGFILGGISAGGNFTCLITQCARSDPDLQGKITGQILQIPCTLFHFPVPEKVKDRLVSIQQNSSDPMLTHNNIVLTESAYKAGDPSNPKTSPLLAESFENLPPAYIQIAGSDPLRDEGLLYNEFLQEASVPTKLDVYPGVPHNFERQYPNLELSKKWRDDLDAGLQWLLENRAH